MSALEIVAIVVLCIFGVSNVLLWAQTTVLFDRLLVRHYEEQKKSTSKNEVDDKL